MPLGPALDYDPFASGSDAAPEQPGLGPALAYDPFPTTVAGHAGEVLPGVAAGAVEAFGTAMRGLAATMDPGEKYRGVLEAVGAASTDADYEAVADEAAKLRYGGRGLLNVIRAAREGNRDPWQAAVDSLPGPAEERPLWRAGEAVSRFAEEHFGAEPGYEDALPRVLAEGVGSLGAGILATAATGPLGGTSLFAAMGAGEAADRAVAAGASEEDVRRAALLGVGAGATDIVPVEILMRRLPAPGRRAVIEATKRLGGEKVVKALGRITMQGTVEALQEGGQQALQNLIAREVYAPEQRIGEGIVPSAGVGGGVGAIAGIGREGVLAIASRRSRSSRGARKRAVDSVPPPSQEDEASPIPTRDIQEGRERIADAEATAQANEWLGIEGLPSVGQPVRVSRGGGPVLEGVVTDAAPEDGGWVTVEGPGGSVVLDESLQELRSRGVAIEGMPMPPTAQERAQAEREAGKLLEGAAQEQARFVEAVEARRVKAQEAARDVGAETEADVQRGGRAAESVEPEASPVTVAPVQVVPEVLPEEEAALVDPEGAPTVPADERAPAAVPPTQAQATLRGPAETAAGIAPEEAPDVGPTTEAAPADADVAAAPTVAPREAALAGPEGRVAGVEPEGAQPVAAQAAATVAPEAARDVAPEPARIVKADGTPFKTEQSARVAAKSRGIEEAVPVEVEGGWALQPQEVPREALPEEAPPAGDPQETAAVEPEEAAVVAQPEAREVVLEGAEGAASAVVPEEARVVPVDTAPAQPAERARLVEPELVTLKGYEAAHRGVWQRMQYAMGGLSRENSRRASETIREVAVEMGRPQWNAIRPEQRPEFIRRIESRAVDMEAAQANPAPTDAQKEAGNYRKGHVRAQGLDISIENARGSERSGTAPDGSKWSVRMPAHYGYVRRTEGADGDQVDVYVGPEPDAPIAFVVDQQDADSKEFDEHKVMLGYPSEEAALADYDAAFDDGRGPERRRAVTPMSMPSFKRWLASGDTKTPAAEPIVKANGQPFASRQSAMLAARNKRMENAEPVAVTGGWALRRGPAATPQRQEVAETAKEREPDVAETEVEGAPLRRDTAPAEGKVRIRVARRFTEQQAAVKADMERTGREVFGRNFRVEVAERITAPEGDAARGAFDPANRIAYIAMQQEAGAMDATLAHEGIHYLRAAGAFSNEDGTPSRAWQTLEREGPKWRKRYGIDERYGRDAPESLKNEEAIAEAYADYASRGQETGFGPLVRSALNRIGNFFKRVASGLRGRGFQTARDIFEQDVAAGAAGRRADARADVTIDEVLFRRTQRKEDSPAGQRVNRIVASARKAATLRGETADDRVVSEAATRPAVALAKVARLAVPSMRVHQAAVGVKRADKAMLSAMRGTPNADWKALDQAGIVEPLEIKRGKRTDLAQIPVAMFVSPGEYARAVAYLGALNQAQDRGMPKTQRKRHAQDVLDQVDKRAEKKPGKLPMRSAEFFNVQARKAYGVPRRDLRALINSLLLLAGAFGLSAEDLAALADQWKAEAKAGKTPQASAIFLKTPQPREAIAAQ